MDIRRLLRGIVEGSFTGAPKGTIAGVPADIMARAILGYIVQKMIRRR